jgi:hypothetical protein
MKNQCKQTMFSHGECNFFQLTSLPVTIKKIEVRENYLVVGESETHGNDHRVAVLDKENVQFFRDSFERLYLKADIETKVYCPKEGRHDEIIIKPGIYEINKSMEVDPLTRKLRQVAD